ncbi:MAG TPA: hypothetical protein VEK56_09415, partial [Vicinamibacterales bacterium]|nr:hypothetical protein [Vicinamibacterales bacterium]
RRDAPRPRRQTWSELHETGHRHRSFEGATCRRPPPAATVYGQTEDETEREVREPRCPTWNATGGQALARDQPCIEA